MGKIADRFTKKALRAIGSAPKSAQVKLAELTRKPDARGFPDYLTPVNNPAAMSYQVYKIIQGNVKLTVDWANPVYCDRRTILGNPKVMDSEAQRDEVCDYYETYFNLAKDQDPEFESALDALYQNLMDSGVVTLLCWCKTPNNPKRCHTDTIANYLLDRLMVDGHDGAIS